VRIHPFRDGNGRMARLLMNFILLKNGYPLLNIFDSEKLLYYLKLQEADFKKRSKPFVKYLFRVYALQYKGYLNLKGVR
jgi:Fic family protein